MKKKTIYRQPECMVFLVIPSQVFMGSQLRSGGIDGMNYNGEEEDWD